MKISASSTDLVAALTKVRGIVERTNIMPILGCCKLSARDGVLHITTSDLNSQAMTALPCEVQSEGDIALEALGLSTFIGKLPKDGQVTICSSGLVQCGRARATFSTLPGSDFPIYRNSEPVSTFELSPDDVRHLLLKTAVAADTNSIKEYLCGVTLNGDGAQLCATASDCKMVVRSIADVKADRFDSIIIPSKALSTLSGMLDDEAVTITVCEEAIRFSCESFTLDSRLINYEAVNFDSILPSSFSYEASVDRGDLLTAVDRVSCITDHKDGLIKASLNGGPMVIESAIGGKSSGNEEIDVSYDGPAISIGFNAKQLMKLASVLTSETIDIQFTDLQTPIGLHDPAHQGQVVVTPVLV